MVLKNGIFNRSAYWDYWLFCHVVLAIRTHTLFFFDLMFRFVFPDKI